MSEDKPRLIIASNRLPIVITDEDNKWRIAPGAGGLITALAPVIKEHNGLWIGWPGSAADAPLEELFDSFTRDQGYRLYGVELTEEEIDRYYRGFSNETLWPLFHDLLGYCNYSRDNWQCYKKVNRRFAEAIAANVRAGDLVWIHDYQLILTGSYLRKLGFEGRLGFFNHIPFPSHDLFRRLPWKQELITAMLAYDLLGFQTKQDRRNFVNCATAQNSDLEVVNRQRQFTLLRHNRPSGERLLRVGHFPISIDFEDFNSRARSKEVDEAAWYLHEHLHKRQLLLGIDRLDYTKGIPERFLAFERALEKYPDLLKNITLLQVVVPSRTLVPDYQNLKGLLDSLAGRINAQFGDPSWVPIHYKYSSLDSVQLLAHYRASEIALITPLRDGMNLVAKEYCASSINDNGVLILSEFAGAAEQLGRYALLVNPYDVDATADAIHTAFVMDPKERRNRMHRLREQIKRANVKRWSDSFLNMLSREAP